MHSPQKASSSAEARLALFDFAFDHAPIGVAIVDRKGCIQRGNQVFSELIGIPVEAMPGTHFSVFTHPDDLHADLALFKAVLDGERDGYSIEKRYIRPDRSIRHVSIHIAAMRDKAGNVIRFLSQIQDISAQKESERLLAEKAAQLELAMEAVRGGFWHMDVAAGRFETSERLAQFIAGPDAARLDLEAYLARVNPQDSQSADLTPLLSGVVDQSCAEYRLDTVLGERWIRCDRRLLRNPDGTPRRVVGVAIDFTDEHRRLKELEHRSETDMLTGLLNRRGLANRFPDMASSDGYAVLTADLDGFKTVNDSHGHGAGDGVLIETARRIERVVRCNDLVCRTGGDEFVIVLAGPRRVAETVAARIVDVMREPIHLDGIAVKVLATVGGVWSDSKAPFDSLLSRADERLYEAKAAGKDQWRLGIYA